MKFLITGTEVRHYSLTIDVTDPDYIAMIKRAMKSPIDLDREDIAENYFSSIRPENAWYEDVEIKPVRKTQKKAAKS